MKTASIVTLVLVSMLCASFASAADEKKEKGKIGGIYAKLDLTAEQTAKIKEIQEGAKAALKNAGDDKEAKKTVMKETNAKIEALLTDAQKEKLAKLKAEAKQEGDKKKKEPK